MVESVSCRATGSCTVPLPPLRVAYIAPASLAQCRTRVYSFEFDPLIIRDDSPKRFTATERERETPKFREKKVNFKIGSLNSSAFFAAAPVVALVIAIVVVVVVVARRVLVEVVKHG